MCSATKALASGFAGLRHVLDRRRPQYHRQASGGFVTFEGMDVIYNGSCSHCGRESNDCTTAELGEWIVERGGRLTCSECAKQVDQDAGKAS
jgi:hypothetical protein